MTIDGKILVEKEVTDPKGTRQFAKSLLSYLVPGTTVLLYGNLGSGKTFLTREIVRLLGIPAEVSSPSFTIINQYSDQVNHIDLYRIKDLTELIHLGLEEILNTNTIIFIEWPEIIENLINWSHLKILIETQPHDDKWRNFKLIRCN